MIDIQKFQTYLELVKTKQDKHGFIESHEADSLLFSGLVGCVPGVEVDIEQALSEDGAWLRRPKDNPAYPDHTKSTISRDMLVGLLYYCYFNKRLDLLEHTIKYALKHFFIMGKAKTMKDRVGRCLITPQLLSLYAWASYRLGGPSRIWLRYLPTAVSRKQKGYQAHLAVLVGLFENIVKKTNKNQKLLDFYAKKEPLNDLFQVAAGKDPSSIYNIILFPNKKLPNSMENRKEPWLWQRDSMKDGILHPDWRPGGNPRTHSGGDLLFVMWLHDFMGKKM